MAESFNGCGTAFYGKCDVEPDGSFITTEFNTIFFVPMGAVASYRVRPIGKSYDSFLIIFSSSKKYDIFKEVPLNIKQSRHIHMFAWFIVSGSVKV
jgi:hypothetical protein